MPQLNVLPISVSQNVDVVDESSATIRTKDNDDFSQLIDQHLASSHEKTGERLNKASKTDKKTDADKVDATQVSNVSNKSEAEQLAQKLAQKSAKQVNETNDNSADESQTVDSQGLDTEQQKVAASGKNGQEPATSTVNTPASSTEKQALLASEQLMSFLYKADNTLLADSKSEPLSPEQKALYEAQLLLNSSNLVADLSGVAKALSPESSEQYLAQNITDKKHQLSASGVQPIVDKGIARLPVEPIPAEPIGKGEQQATLIADTTDLLIKTEKNAENIVSKQAEQGMTTKSSVEQGVLEHEKARLLALEAIKVQNSDNGNSSKDAASQFENTQSALNKKIAELALSKQTQKEQNKEPASSQSAAITGGQGSKQENNQAITNQPVGNQPTNNQPISTQGVTGENITQSPDQKPVAHKVTLSTQTNSGVMGATEQSLSKAQEQKIVKELGQEHLSAKNQNQTIEKIIEKISDEIIVEDKPIKPVKAEFSANASFTDVSSNATQVAQHSLEQQSLDTLNPAVSTEVIQSQKTNAQLHQETIAIFRKDFADAVKDKVMLMVSQKLQRFDITLDPPELGNMQVRVNLQNEQAMVSFVVQNQQAKEALEQNIHKLRDMLAQQGVDVGDANIEQQSQQSDGEGGAAGSNHQQGETAMASDMIEHTLSAHQINASANAVDYYV